MFYIIKKQTIYSNRKDRLPFYERIYNQKISMQTPRYERAPRLSPRSGMPITEGVAGWGKHEMNMFHDLVVISRGQDSSRVVNILIY